jgi:type I restriction enzyme S subunit
MKYQAYKEYKDSGVEWLGVIPEHWNVCAIKHIVSIPITDGPHETPNFFDSGIPFISAEAISTGRIDFEKIRAHISEEDNEKYSKKYFPQKYDIYMVKSGATTGITAIVETDIKFNIWSPLAVIRCNEKSSPYFVLNFLRSFNFKEAVELNWSFGTQQNIGMGVIENLHVAKPPLLEQQKIATFLDYETAKIDTLIEKQQQLIKLLKEKRQAVISHAVTKGLNPNAPIRDSGVEWLGEVPEHWDVWKFSHIAPIITCGIASTPTYVDENEGMPFLSAQNVRDNKLTLHKYNFIPYDLHEQLTRNRKPEKGDLLVTRVGAGIGDACVIDIDMEFSIYVSLTHIRVIPDTAVNRFIMYFFGSDYCKYLNHQGTVTGGGVGNLNVNNVEKYKIPLPQIEEQNKIVKFLDDKGVMFDELIEKAKSTINLMQERRTALISAAVTGKIDVRNWQTPHSENKDATA